MANWLNPEESRAWRALLQMNSRLEAHLHRRLMNQTGLSLSDYHVLAVLSEAPEDRLRAYELGATIQWEKSRLSHHLRRMEDRGLVERRTCETDGRGLWVGLTSEGREAIENAAPHHVADVRALVIDLLTPEQIRSLAEISEKIIAEFPSDGPACSDS